MEYLTKKEIAKYLHDYYVLSNLMVDCSCVNLETLFAGYFTSEGRYNECTEEYYKTMRNVASMFLMLKIFSFSEDYLIDYLNENEIDFIKEDIFKNKEDAKYFCSKKKLLMYIRNAFNHSEGEKQLYSISKDGKYLYINLKNTKEKHPLNLQLDMEQLVKISEALLKAKHNLFIFSPLVKDDFNLESDNLYSELDKIEFRYYYFPKKISTNTLENTDSVLKRDITNDIERKKKSEDFKSCFANENYQVKNFTLEHEHKVKFCMEYIKLKNLIESKKIDNLPTFSHDREYYIHYILKRCFPLGSLHYDTLNLEHQFVECFLQDLSISYSAYLDKMGNIYNEIKDDSLCEYYKDIDDYFRRFYNTPTKKCNLLLDSNDIEIKKDLSMAIYLGYIVDTLIDDEEIEIEGCNYSREKLRDSFVHGRWFTTGDGTIEFYDGMGKNKNYCTFDWHESININDLKMWGENIYKTKLISQKKENLFSKVKKLFIGLS